MNNDDGDDNVVGRGGGGDDDVILVFYCIKEEVADFVLRRPTQNVPRGAKNHLARFVLHNPDSCYSDSKTRCPIDIILPKKSNKNLTFLNSK